MNQNKGNVFLGMALHADVPATVNQILSLASIDCDDGESFPQDKNKVHGSAVIFQIARCLLEM